MGKAMHKRILLLGTTGIKKANIAHNVKKVMEEEHSHIIKIIDFEKDYFKESTHYRSMSHFLNSERYIQDQIWNDAWKNLSKYLENSHDNTPIMLILHGVYVNPGYGVRSFLDFNDVCSTFQPSLIITLIDDIFNMWWRTFSYADGDKNQGQPTFEQLLMARRAEIIVGDLIAHQNSLEKPARHIVCSVNHPISIIIKIILVNAGIVYLSFPISEPRRLFKAGDRSFIDAINRLHNMASNRANNKVVYISPLAIDELPLCVSASIKIIEKEKEKEKISLDEKLDKANRDTEYKKLDNLEFHFEKKMRWPISELWHDKRIMYQNIPELPDKINIPVIQLENICGIIKTDIGWRDYKLIDQADALAIFCPIPPGRGDVTRGVMAEWQKAAVKALPCYVFQNPDWDPEKKTDTYTDDPGSMGTQPINCISKRVENVEELFERCENIIER